MNLPVSRMAMAYSVPEGLNSLRVPSPEIVAIMASTNWASLLDLISTVSLRPVTGVPVNAPAKGIQTSPASLVTTSLLFKPSPATASQPGFSPLLSRTFLFMYLMSATALVLSNWMPQALRSLSRVSRRRAFDRPSCHSGCCGRALDGVEKGNKFAAAHEELVNGILRLVRDLGGPNNQKDVDVIVNLVSGELHLSDVEIVAKFADEGPRRPERPSCSIMGLDSMPNTGSPLMMPTTGFSGLITREMARDKSYLEQALAVRLGKTG